MTRFTSVLLLVLVSLAGAAGPAAADGDVGFSTDGSTWGAALPSPLFDPATRWVPGDERTKTFFVRNESDSSASMEVDFVGGPLQALLETGDLTVSARADGGPRQETSSPGTHQLVSDVTVAASGVVRVEVTVAFDPASGNQSQLLASDLGFRVRLTQTGVSDGGLGDNGGTDEGGGGLLPETGAPTLWFLILGLALVGAGSLTAFRRPTKEDSRV